MMWSWPERAGKGAAAGAAEHAEPVEQRSKRDFGPRGTWVRAALCAPALGLSVPLLRNASPDRSHQRRPHSAGFDLEQQSLWG